MIDVLVWESRWVSRMKNTCACLQQRTRRRRKLRRRCASVAEEPETVSDFLTRRRGARRLGGQLRVDKKDDHWGNH